MNIHRTTLSRLRLDGDNVVRSPAEDISLAPRPLYQHMWEGEVGRRWPDRVAVEDAITGRKYSFDEGRAECARVARSLQDLGLRRGDVAAVFLPNCPEYAVVVGGAAMAGVVTSTMNPVFTPGEVARQLELSRPKVVFAEAAAAETIGKACQKIGGGGWGGRERGNNRNLI